MVQLVTIAKLAQACPDADTKVNTAMAALRNAVAGLEVGFGKGGGEVGNEARSLLLSLERTLHESRTQQSALR